MKNVNIMPVHRIQVFLGRILGFGFFFLTVPAAGTISLFLDHDASPRVQFGADTLRQALQSAGYTVTIVSDSQSGSGPVIFVGTVEKSEGIERLQNSGRLRIQKTDLAREGFVVTSCDRNVLAVAGADDTGTLYGSMELARRIRRDKKLPSKMHISDAPKFVLRGACIGMQKTTILPGRHIYEYPYTPELFPLFL